MAILCNSALSHKLSVILLPIYLEPLPVQGDSIPVAPLEVIKVNVGRGQTGHFKTAWHNKWKCPISASRHEVYSCHWCHQIKSAHKSQSYQSLPWYYRNSGIQELQSHLLVLLVPIGMILRHLFGNNINELWIYKKDINPNWTGEFCLCDCNFREKNEEKWVTSFHLWKFISIISKLIK